MAKSKGKGTVKQRLPQEGWSGHPLVKWPGGKSSELKQISAVMPKVIDRYLEPFVGGGAVWLSLPSTTPAAVNDIGEDLIDFYRVVEKGDHSFFKTLGALFSRWTQLEQLVDLYSPEAIDYYRRLAKGRCSVEEWSSSLEKVVLEQEDLFAPLLPLSKKCQEQQLFAAQLRDSLINKAERLLKLEQQHGALKEGDLVATIETALKGALYTTVRQLYNHPGEYGVKRPVYLALFWFVREFAYASMFRQNASGEFNVPYGGNSYNRKEWGIKVEALRSKALRKRLSTTEICAGDFESFLQQQSPTADDFIFVDPPYDTTFSRYDGVGFGEAEHRRLAEWLIEKCPARWLLVIQSSELIASLYANRISVREGVPLKIETIDKIYRWTIKERNSRSAQLLFIANYSFAEEGLW